MKKECVGCYLIRICFDNIIYKNINNNSISCEYENLNCPCKICIVKVTCNVSDFENCERWIEFNLEHSSNEYWELKRKENATKRSL